MPRSLEACRYLDCLHVRHEPGIVSVEVSGLLPIVNFGEIVVCQRSTCPSGGRKEARIACHPYRVLFYVENLWASLA